MDTREKVKVGAVIGKNGVHRVQPVQLYDITNEYGKGPFASPRAARAPEFHL